MPTPAPNPNDGTTLLGGSGDVIADESVEVSTGVRREPLLPPSAYKLPRSKIVVGPYGQDWGDATADQPLQVDAAALRRMQEIQALLDRQTTLSTMARYAAETITMCDSRGRHLESRGTR